VIINKDNQQVGLEAAILLRKRNSTLVKFIISINVGDLRFKTELAN